MNTISLKPGFKLVAMCITVPVFAVALGCVATMPPTTAVAPVVPGSNGAGGVVGPGSVPPPVAAPVAGPAPPIFPLPREAPAAGPPAVDPHNSPTPAPAQAGPSPGPAPMPSPKPPIPPPPPQPVDPTATGKSKARVSPECKFCGGPMAGGPIAGPAPSTKPNDKQRGVATPANKLPQVMTAPAAQPAAKLPASIAKSLPNKARANGLKDVGKNIEQPTR